MMLRFVRGLMALGVVLGCAGIVRPAIMANPSRSGAAAVLAISLLNLWQFKDLR